MPHEYFGRPEAAKRKPTGRRIPCRSRLSLWEWQSFRSYPFSRDSRGSSAHPTIPPTSVVLSLDFHTRSPVAASLSAVSFTLE